jgi:hypothetical protein
VGGGAIARLVGAAAGAIGFAMTTAASGVLLLWWLPPPPGKDLTEWRENGRCSGFSCGGIGELVLL